MSSISNRGHFMKHLAALHLDLRLFVNLSRVPLPCFKRKFWLARECSQQAWEEW